MICLRERKLKLKEQLNQKQPPQIGAGPKLHKFSRIIVIIFI